MATRFVFLLEEKSMQETLNGLLPRIFPDNVQWLTIPHEGKQDLENSIPRKLRAWNEPNVRFIVLRDKDSAHCKDTKKRLNKLCRDGKRPNTLVRIACHELESWFLGDLRAVEMGFQVNHLAKLQKKRKYRDPDNLGSPFTELKHLIKEYQKVSGARTIGPHLNPDNNLSRSFQGFVKGLRRLYAEEY